ncbi:hypothetical protein [Spartinivicinus ruber]|uniref:hypothetical protein n=1 Tax=Spartinivicinus ruber TaxID=2683272 RepID=UPI0013D0D9BE|nr:hypothetical protein [Spartinivicinus ruber]
MISSKGETDLFFYQAKIRRIQTRLKELKVTLENITEKNQLMKTAPMEMEMIFVLIETMSQQCKNDE